MYPKQNRHHNYQEVKTRLALSGVPKTDIALFGDRFAAKKHLLECPFVAIPPQKSQIGGENGSSLSSTATKNEQIDVSATAAAAATATNGVGADPRPPGSYPSGGKQLFRPRNCEAVTRPQPQPQPQMQ